MKIIVLFMLVAVLQGAAFAQKTQNPELRNEHAANPKKTQSHKSKSVTTLPVRSKGDSAAELAKIEQSGTRKTGAHRSTRAKAALPSSQTGAAAQGKNKPVRFSHHSSHAAGKAPVNGGRTAASSRPPKTLR